MNGSEMLRLPGLDDIMTDWMGFVLGSYASMGFGIPYLDSSLRGHILYSLSAWNDAAGYPGLSLKSFVHALYQFFFRGDYNSEQLRFLLQVNVDAIRVQVY